MIIQNFSTLKRHIFYWCLFILYELAVSYSYSHGFSPILDYFTGYVLNISVFYIHADLVERNYHQSRISYLFILLLTLAEVVIYVLLKHIVIKSYQILHLQGHQNVVGTEDIIRDAIWRCLYFVGLSSAYSINMIARALLTKSNKLQVNYLNSDRERLKTEIAFLKSQINPHFVFNSLGLIHNKVLAYSDEAAEMIILLSDIMRFALAPADEHGLIALETEIAHVKNYVLLNQKRFDHKLNLEVEISDDINNVRVIPLILLTLLENIFKYGDLTIKAFPAKIRAFVQSDEIMIQTENLKNNQPELFSTGIGLDNLRKRLASSYGDDYYLFIEDQQNSFTVKLGIKLN